MNAAAIVASAIGRADHDRAAAARRRPVINAIGGLFGTGLAAFIAVRSGKAEGFFVPEDALPAGARRVVFAGSVVVRRPLTGYIVGALYRAEPGWATLPDGPAGDDRVHARLGRAVRAARGGLRRPDPAAGKRRCRSPSPRSLSACRRSACCCCGLPLRAVAARAARRADHRGPQRHLERPVDVGPVALQRAQRRRARRVRSSVDGRTRTSIPSAASTSSARSAIATCPNAVGCTWSAITRLRAPKSRRSSTSAPWRAAASMIAFASTTVAPARGRPRSSGIVTHEHPLAAPARGTRARPRGRRANASGVPVRRAHVVDADVQAAEVVARVRARRARREGRRAARRRRRATRAPSTAYVVNGSPSPRATHSAHDCSATPHCSSPPPLVIESPNARTPSGAHTLKLQAELAPASVAVTR